MKTNERLEKAKLLFRGIPVLGFSTKKKIQKKFSKAL